MVSFRKVGHCPFTSTSLICLMDEFLVKKMSPGKNLRGLFRNVVGVFPTEPRLHASDHAAVRKAKECVANQECR